MANTKRIFLFLFKFCIIVVVLLCLSLISALITMNLVSKADLVKVPSVVGKDTVDALDQLNKIGLRLKIIDKEFNDLIPENHIIVQDPKPRTLIQRDRAVKAVLSKGSEKVDVPNVVDEPWLRAQDIIQEAGLKIGRLARTHHDKIRKNRVIAQNPAGNSMIPRGESVDLLLSEGNSPKGFYMPDLLDIPIESALERLRNAGLYPGQITYKHNSIRSPNTVISQWPKFGFRVFSDEKINLEVSKEEKLDQEEAGIYTTLTYRVPHGIEEKEVKIVLQSENNTKEIFRQIRPPGDEIELLIRTTRNTKAQIYLDSELVEERQF
ncbi:MAG: PASTA domain-containing protein [bacterium]